MAAVGHPDVRGLQVAVDDPRRVRRVERVGDLGPEREDPFDLHRHPADRPREALPLQELHRDEEAPLVLADLVNGGQTAGG